MQNKVLSLFRFLLLIGLLHASNPIAQAQTFPDSSASTIEELKSQTAKWLQSKELGGRRLTVRDIRQVGQRQNLSQLTGLIKQAASDAGYQIAQQSDYELEGRITTNNTGGKVLVLNLIGQRDFESSFGMQNSISLADSLYATLLRVPRPSGQIDGTHQGTEKPNFRVRPVKSERWQIGPETEWQVSNLDRNALSHVRQSTNQTGFIIDGQSWSAFWKHLDNGQPLPTVDFSTHALVVLYADHPSKIIYKVLTRGKTSSWDFLRDDKPGPVDSSNRLDAVVLLLPREPQPSLGVTIEMAETGNAILIKAVMQNSAITHGINPDGEQLSCEPGDLITSINGKPVVNIKQLGAAVSQANETIVLDIKDVKTGIIRPFVFYLQ